MQFHLTFELLLISSSFTVTWGAICPDGMVYEEEVDRCFSYQNTPATFMAAETICQSMGAHLISIRNGFENAIISGYQTTNIGSNMDFWIGANLLFSDKWQWIDNQVFNYSMWMCGEPVADRPCGSMMTNSGLWRSLPCTDSKSFVCASSTLPPLTTTIPPTTPVPCPVCPTPPKPVPTPTPVVCPAIPRHCPTGFWSYFNQTESCYLVQLDSPSIPAAEEFCIRQGGHLTSIHSDAENIHVTYLAAAGIPMQNWRQTLIGMYRDGNTWKNYDGTNADYFNWSVNQPDNWEGNENCVQIFSDPPSDSTVLFRSEWNDIACDRYQRNAVCKMPALK